MQTLTAYSTLELLSLQLRAAILVDKFYIDILAMHLGRYPITDSIELKKLYNAIRLEEHFRMAHNISISNDHLELIFY